MFTKPMFSTPHRILCTDSSEKHASPHLGSFVPVCNPTITAQFHNASVTLKIVGVHTSPVTRCGIYERLRSSAGKLPRDIKERLHVSGSYFRKSEQPELPPSLRFVRRANMHARCQEHAQTQRILSLMGA